VLESGEAISSRQQQKQSSKKCRVAAAVAATTTVAAGATFNITYILGIRSVCHYLYIFITVISLFNTNGHLPKFGRLKKCG
jgi:hypothetical protein